MKRAHDLIKALTRRKTDGAEDGSKLARVLTLLDLTALGVGSTLGLGVYVLAGSVAKLEAGPAACLSFLVAAIASGVAGLCYAEFASRVPKAGSAYVYSYVCVGEYVAFIIGWNLILEYVIGTASVARGLSNYIDVMADNRMRKTLTELFPININFLSTYPDFLSFLLIMMLTILLSIGVKESTILNNLFTFLNLITVSIVVISGAFKADPQNWKISKEQIPPNVDGGVGGFMPFGMAGVMAGAAKCFYGFVGFDTVATTGEEAKNPQKNIPFAIVISLIVVFLAYFSISTVLTLMWPYYDQDASAPFPYVFDQVGWPVIKWIVTIGAIFALCTSLLGAMFPLPRIIYAMSNDGLMFKSLAKIHPKTKTPLIATILSGTLAGIMAMIFDLQQLINMMSIGTLLAYTIVAICVLILRYHHDENEYCPQMDTKQNEHIIQETLFSVFKELFNLNMNKCPSATSSNITKWSIVLFSIMSAIFCAFIIYAGHLLSTNEPFYLTLFLVVLFSMVMLLVVIARQPTANIDIAFKVPWVPLVPCLSVLINVYLMLELDVQTWIRFVLWLIIGFLIYFFYGIQHSEEGIKNELKVHTKRTSSSATTVTTVDNTKEEKEMTRM